MVNKRTPQLLAPLVLRGGLHLPNRVIMAPMTRSRASEPGGVPSSHAPKYYAQRASAGLIVTEATNISHEGKGYSGTPGIHADEQVEAWARVAGAVHARGGRVFMQLWHVGRLARRETCGTQPIAPSCQVAPAEVWVMRANAWSGMAPCEPAREMTVGDIKRVVADFARAAGRAVDAGFDGVELHGANGYLIDQFLRRTTNRRTDAYGGAVENRQRFLREVVEAVGERVGPGRIGVRFSPLIGYADGQDTEMPQTVISASQWLDRQEIAYLHVAEADASFDALEKLGDDFRNSLRDAFAGPIVVAHQYDAERAEEELTSGLADAVAFGRPFIANPDLVTRIAQGAPFVESDTTTWYGGDAVGYTDYRSLATP